MAIAMSHFAINVEDQFLNTRFSVVDIEIVEEGVQLGSKRRRSLTIPGHSMVLMGFSSYCKVKLMNWSLKEVVGDTPGSPTSSTTSSTCRTTSMTQHTIQLPVPAGQIDMAARLIQGMYQQVPGLEDLNQHELLQLLLLADRFEVLKVQAAVLDAFEALSADDLEWDTTLALLDLPVSCYSTKVTNLADQKFMQKLGDLEKVWADAQLQELLLNLPHDLLLHLLEHDKTRVTSKSTVVYSILQWWERQQQEYRENHVQQLQELMQQVRMQHLSILYISTYMMNDDAVLLCYNMRELGIACSCTDPRSREALQDGGCPIVQQNPAWTAAKRPASYSKRMLEWRLLLADVPAAVARLLSGRKAVQISGPQMLMQGRALRIEAELDIAGCAAEGESDSVKEIGMSLFLRVDNRQQGNVCIIEHSFTMKAAQSDLECQQRDLYYGALSNGYGDESHRYGYCALWIETDCGIHSLADVEALLREKGLVHADGCMYIEAAILDMA